MRAQAAFSLRRFAGWRRPIAAALVALLGFWSVAAFAAPISSATGPEICRGSVDTAAKDGAANDGTADAAHHHRYSCLLCLPGCAALSAADEAPALGGLSLAAEPLALPPHAAPAALRAAAAHRPRGPPV